MSKMDFNTARDKLWSLCLQCDKAGMIQSDADFYGIFAGFVVVIDCARGGKREEIQAKFQQVLDEAFKPRIVLPEEKEVVVPPQTGLILPFTKLPKKEDSDGSAT